MPQSLRNRINLQRHEDPRKALMILLHFLCWAACALLALMSDAKTQRTCVEQNKLLLWCKKAQKPMTEKLMFLVLNSKSTHSHILLSLEIYKYMALSVLPIRAYPGVVVLPYMAYTGMCRWTGYGFVLSVLNRVYSFARVCP